MKKYCKPEVSIKAVNAFMLTASENGNVDIDDVYSDGGYIK